MDRQGTLRLRPRPPRPQRVPPVLLRPRGQGEDVGCGLLRAVLQYEGVGRGLLHHAPQYEGVGLGLLHDVPVVCINCVFYDLGPTRTQ